MHDWLRKLPPNVQGALWLVSGGFIFTSTSVMIRLLSAQIESVQTAFFRAVISVLLLLPMIAAGHVKPWQSKRLAGHFWRTFMGTSSMVLGFYAVSMLPLADATNEFQTQYIKRHIERARGNMTAAADKLGLHRSNLYRKMKTLGIGPKE